MKGDSEVAVGKDLNRNDFCDSAYFSAWAASFTNTVKTSGLKGTGVNLCVNT